jgi:hypothetical protein
MEARLVIRYGPFPSQEYLLPDHTVTIGREPANDIALTDPEISRRHARIMYQAGRYVVEDLGSTNGTFVNGRRISEPVVLKPGDVVDFAEYVGFTFATAVDPLHNTLLEPDRSEAGLATAMRPRPAAVTPPPVTEAPAYTPPVAPTTAVPPPVAPAKPAANYPLRLLAGCGCLLFLLAFLCAATIFWVDAARPELLYCGPLRPLFESLLEMAGLAWRCP